MTLPAAKHPQSYTDKYKGGGSLHTELAICSLTNMLLKGWGHTGKSNEKNVV